MKLIFCKYSWSSFQLITKSYQANIRTINISSGHEKMVYSVQLTIIAIPSYIKAALMVLVSIYFHQPNAGIVLMNPEK